MESQTVFNSKVKFNGVFPFKDFYKFAHSWLVDELGMDVEESEYGEKITGSSKEVKFKWKGTRKITDYFMFEVKMEYKILNMVDVEVMKGDVKQKANKGEISISIKGNLVRDYDGKWETSAWLKFWRGVYEKYVIKARINEYEGKLIEDVQEYTEQLKAFLALEGITQG